MNKIEKLTRDIEKEEQIIETLEAQIHAKKQKLKDELRDKEAQLRDHKKLARELQAELEREQVLNWVSEMRPEGTEMDEFLLGLEYTSPDTGKYDEQESEDQQ